MKYYVYYIEDGSPHISDFKTEKDRKDWMYEWFLKNHHQGCNNGFEIDFIFEGDLSWRGGSYTDIKQSSNR